MEGKAEHWDNIYAKNPGKNIGWYEEEPVTTLRLIDSCHLANDATVFIAGAGTTNLLPFLLEKGYTNIIANDISHIALQTLQSNLGSEAEKVTFITDDLTHPTLLKEMPAIDIWVDRAVLHFFLEREEVDSYFDLLKEKVQPGGYVLIATFSKDGAKKCSGLPVLPYGKEELQICLGEAFTLVKNENVSHYMPSGEERPYHYALFKRN